MRNIFRFVSKVTVVTMIALLFSSSFAMAEEVSSDVIIPVDEGVLNEASDEVAVSVVPDISEIPEVTEALETPDVLEIPEIQGTTETLETPVVSEIPEAQEVQQVSDAAGTEVSPEASTVSPSEAETCLEAESVGTVIDVENASVGSAFDAMSVSVDTLSAELVKSNETMLSAESVETNETLLSATNTYSQPLWDTRQGYDAVSVYLTDVSGDYVQRCFLVTDGKQWLLYDYGEYAAGEFFSQTELKNGKYVPVQKAAMRSDNTDTVGIDESKIPTMAKTSFDAMIYDWKNLADVPFNRNANGSIVYAGSTKESGDSSDSGSGSTTPTATASMNKYSVNIGDNTYTVYLTAAVSYNGRRHVRNTVVASKKYSPDLTVSVYRNGKLLDSRYYTLKYGNNLNVNGYGKEGISPYIRVNLKNVKGLKQDKKVLASYKFKFTIKPVDISKAQLTVKKIRVTNGTKVKLGTPKAKLDGLSISLKAQSSKNPLTGVYKATASGNVITVSGVNNFTGSTTLNLSNAKTIDWIF